MTDENKPEPDWIGSDLVHEDKSFADIVEQFLNELPARLQDMEDAIEANNLEALRCAAHQLKGSGGGYGYPILTQRASELEKLAGNAALDDCVQAVEALKQLCKRVVVETD